MSLDINKVISGVVGEILAQTEKGYAQIKNTSSKMTLDMARKLIKAVEDEASRIGVKAVVAICDGGANTVAVECMDDAYIASFDIAVNKAFTSVSLKMSTKKLSELSQPGKDLYGIQFTNNGKIVIFGGGETLCSTYGIIGGLGVSGGSLEQDTYLADFGKKYFENNL